MTSAPASSVLAVFRRVLSELLRQLPEELESTNPPGEQAPLLPIPAQRAAQEMGFTSQRAFLAWCRANRVPVHKIGERFFLLAEEVRAALKERPASPESTPAHAEEPEMRAAMAMVKRGGRRGA